MRLYTSSFPLWFEPPSQARGGPKQRETRVLLDQPRIDRGQRAMGQAAYHPALPDDRHLCTHQLPLRPSCLAIPTWRNP